MKYKIGEKVFWTDPCEGFSNGFYKIIKIMENKQYFIRNEIIDTIAYEWELSKI